MTSAGLGWSLVMVWRLPALTGVTMLLGSGVARLERSELCAGAVCVALQCTMVWFAASAADVLVFAWGFATWYIFIVSVAWARGLVFGRDVGVVCWRIVRGGGVTEVGILPAKKRMILWD